MNCRGLENQTSVVVWPCRSDGPHRYPHVTTRSHQGHSPYTGRPRKRWRDNVAEDYQALHQSSRYQNLKPTDLLTAELSGDASGPEIKMFHPSPFPSSPFPSLPSPSLLYSLFLSPPLFPPYPLPLSSVTFGYKGG